MAKQKPLRFGSSVDDLKPHISKYVKPGTGTKSLLHYTQALHDKMLQFRREGDQEVEYIYGMAFIENMMDLRKRKDFATFTPHPTQKLLLSSVSDLEALKKTLETRYLSNNQKKSKVAPAESKVKRKEEPELMELLPENGRKGIKCEELMKVLRLGKEPLAKLEQFILLIDIRPGAEFIDNRIKFDESFSRKYAKPKITHVDHVKPGAIASQLTSTGSKSKDGFSERHRALLIAIFTNKSSTTDLHEPNNPIRIVYEALTKYDTPRCVERVYVLEGGLAEWSGLYTHLTSNPKRPQTHFTDSHIIESAIRADYDNILEKPKPKPEPTPPPTAAAKVPKELEKPKLEKKQSVDEDLTRAEARIVALNKERAELELANAKKKRENEELDIVKRNTTTTNNRPPDQASMPVTTKIPSINTNTPPSRPTAPKPVKERKPSGDSKLAPIPKPTEQTVKKPAPLEIKARTLSESATAPKTPATPRFQLPEHWGQKLDAKSNRYYYIDHRTKTTSWNPPDSTISTPRIDRTGKPVPVKLAEPNWELLSPAHGHGLHGKTGLKNLGNTCYMNAILQSLAALYPLANHFIMDKYKKEVNMVNILGYKGRIADQFGLVMKGLWRGSFKYLRPDLFRREISECKYEFASSKQQDAQELLLFLLDGLHEDLNQVKDRRYIEEKDANGRPDEEVAAESWENHRRLNKSIIVDLFQGQFKNTLKCLSCKYTSIKFDAFMFLSLPIPEKGRSDLAECLRQFQKKERLEGAERWFCPKCKASKDSERTLELWRIPPLLIIHLKRFRSEGRWKAKVQTQIDYPLDNFKLDVKGNYKRPPYKLISVTNHQGASTDSGHYTAYCRRGTDDKQHWVKADDSEVTPLNKSVVSSFGYILFYSSRPQDQEPGGAAKFTF